VEKKNTTLQQRGNCRKATTQNGRKYTDNPNT